MKTAQGAVVLVEPQELRQVDPRQAGRTCDLQQVLIVLVAGVVAHVGRAGVDDRVVGLRVEDDELVVDVNLGRQSLVVFHLVARAGHPVDLTLDRADLPPEAFRLFPLPKGGVREDVLLVPGAMEDVDGGRGRRRGLAAGLRRVDAVHEAEHHQAPVGRVEAFVA